MTLCRCFLPLHPRMSSLLPPPARRIGLTAFAALLLSGCADSPTMPGAVQQIAGGDAWLAVPVPESLPTLDVWMRYVPRSGPDDSRTISRVRSLQTEARRARAEGRLEWADEVEREATRLAVLAFDGSLDPVVLAEGLRAVKAWADGVEAGIDFEVYPEMAMSLRRVRRAHDVAGAALASGDTTTAVLQLADAAEVVRAHAPAAVTLRALGQVEARLREREYQSRTVERAVHLVRSARLELVAGDPARALRRALYALQLVEGRHVLEVPDRPEVSRSLRP